MPPPPPRRWTLPEPDRDAQTAARALSRELDLPGPLAQVLVARGLRESADARNFLSPKLNLLSDPFALPNMPAAIERLVAALTKGERIVLYGDYDVDGVTSLTLFKRLLAACGGDVACFLPGRIEEGYGLSTDGVARCVETLRPELLVAVDCGTSSAREIAGLRERGIDSLVFDHHEAGAHGLPEPVALVNPKLGNDYHYLCSAGIVFKAAHALLKTRPQPGFDLKDYLDIVALGTVADIVPLVRENRILVKRGLQQLANSRWPGVRALAEVSGVAGRPLKPADVGFKLGPRLNAAGRLGTAQAALDLLLTEDEGEALELAEALNAQNRERQEVEQRTLGEAQGQLDALAGFPEEHAAIIVGARGWHPGVVGIVASRLMRSHHRPALVVGFDDAGSGKGSGRSIEGLSLVEALNACSHLLDKHGGHAMAAGLSMQEGRFAEFQGLFRDVARAGLTDEQLRPRLKIDAEVRLEDLDADFLMAHEGLQPFGMGNPQPTFLARRVAPAFEPQVCKEKHLRLKLRHSVTAASNHNGINGSRNGGHGGWQPAASGIFFNAFEKQEIPAPPWDVAFTVEPNEYQGRTTLQMQVQALRAAE